jgi:prepilin-type N-terminal cleavage/methylation domain-containing protein
MKTWSKTSRGFSLIELMVVIGIIMILIGILLPTVTRSRKYAVTVNCRSQLHQIGVGIAAYTAQSGGWVVPVEGWLPTSRRWPEILFGKRNPSVVICPDGQDDADRLSYQLNGWLLGRKGILYNRSRTGSSRIVLAGESFPKAGIIYPHSSTASTSGLTSWDPARHGRTFLSNYLWLDYHVSNDIPIRIPLTVSDPPNPDAWYVPR